MDASYFGETIALCTVLSWSCGSLFFTEAARRFGPNTVNHFRLPLALVILTIIATITYSYTPKDLFVLPRAEHWLWFGMSGIIGLTLGDYFGFTSYAILGPRLTSVLTTFAPGAALLFGFILLGETINFVGIVGMLITFTGVVFIALSRTEKEKILQLGHGTITRGILYGILSAISQGVGLVMAKKGMEYSFANGNIPAIYATWMRMLMATVGLYLFSILRNNIPQVIAPVLRNQNRGMVYAVGGTIFGPVIGVSLSLYAVSLVKVVVAQTIFSLLPVFVLPLSFIVYREKITMKSIIGAMVAILGVLILVWRQVIESYL